MVSSVVLAIATPLWSRAADQFGQNKILSITAPVHILFLGLFVYFVKSDAPVWVWFFCAIVFESFVIGSGQMVRRRWIHAIGDDRKLIDTAYSFEALVDEIIFTTGPVIATLVASYFFPAASIFTAMGFLIVGALIFLTQKRTEPPAHPKEPGDDHSLLIRDRFIQALFIPLMMCGAFFSSTGLVIVVSGSIHWKMNETRRFLYSLVALFGLTIPITLAALFYEGNLYMLAIALFFNGLAIAPLLTAGLAVAERSVSEKRTTEVLAWAIAALNLGGAIPTAITGYIIDTYGSSVAFIVPLACMAISLLSLLPFFAIWRRKLHQIPA